MIMFIDLIDACNLKCSTCPRGRRVLRNSSNRMPVETFQRIVDKAVSDGVSTIALFNWSEPFLLDNLYEYAEIVKAAGLPCHCSSNLSLKSIRNFERALRSIDHLTVSVSGSTQEIYEVNHVGGDLQLVRGNLAAISALKSSGRIDTKVVLRLIRFGYNGEEESELENFARRLGIDFEVIDGVGDPENDTAAQYSEDAELEKLRRTGGRGELLKHGEICSLVLYTLQLDCNGDVFLCCARPNYDMFRVGSYLELSTSELLLARYLHPVCSSCGYERREASDFHKSSLSEAFRQRLGYVEPSVGVSGAAEPCRGDAAPMEGGGSAGEGGSRLAITPAERSVRLEAQLSAVKSSTSWRITAPLRTLGDFIRRQRREG